MIRYIGPECRAISRRGLLNPEATHHYVEQNGWDVVETCQSQGEASLSAARRNYERCDLSHGLIGLDGVE